MQNVYGTEVYGTEAHGADNHKSGKREQHQEWSGEWNEAAFIPRNIYLHYSMNLSEEERKEAQGKLYYQAACGKIYVGSGGRGFRAFSYQYSSCSGSPP